MESTSYDNQMVIYSTIHQFYRYFLISTQETMFNSLSELSAITFILTRLMMKVGLVKLDEYIYISKYSVG